MNGGGGHPGDGTTVDAFHRGRFVLVQPARGAHRSGMDALVLAAALPSVFEGDVLDFGAGAGAVGMAVLSRCPAATVTLVESEPEMLHCAEATLTHPANAAFTTRAKLLAADVALTGRARVAAGLADRSADAVLMNPPFNDSRDRQAAGALKARAHVMAPGLIERWLRSAAAVLRPNGIVAVIARPACLRDVLAGLAGRFGAVEIVPVHPGGDRAAIRIVVRAVRGRRGPPSLLPPLVLHEGDAHGLTPRAEAIANGRAALFRD